MDVVSELTVKNLTPPGYFNLSASATTASKNFITWWNNSLNRFANDSINLKTLLLTPWLVNHLDYPRTPYLQYLTTLYGMGFFGGTNNQAAALYRLLSSAWSVSTIYNIVFILQTFSLPPFSWFENSEISAGNLLSSLMDTGFLVYSTASSPATPSPTAYLPRAWTVPAGWTQKASSAVKYSRGYISGSNIVWCAPRPVSDFNNNYIFSVNIPIAVAAAGTVVIVNDDSTGDIASVYYSDGSAWRKNSTSNVDLGQVVLGGNRPSPEAITVWAPNPATVPYSVDSFTPPPADGNSQGYGTFSGWSETSILNDTVTIILTQIAGNIIALSTLIEVLRRIKPVNKKFLLVVSGAQYNITDVRQK